MKITARKPMCDSTGKSMLQTIDPSFIQCNDECILAIDGSTSCTGMAIVRRSDAAIIYTMAVEREKTTESPVHFKVRLKRFVKDMLEHNKTIKEVYYEEPCINQASAVANLFMLRTFVEEMIIENEPVFDYLKHYEINNKRWKKLFLEPEKLAGSTEAEKEQVRKKLVGYIPVFKDLTQDEIDAACMGFVCVTKTNNGVDAEELESKKKTRPFQFNAEFIGADVDDGCLQQLYDYKVPDKVFNNGIKMIEIKGKNNFNKSVYEAMGSDDKLLIVKFPSDTHSDIILNYNLGAMSVQFDYIYALIWRKTRKAQTV